MTFIFDKELATEKSIEMAYYSEQSRNKKISSNKDYTILTQSDFPDISGFSDDVMFSTLEIVDDGMVIPIVGEYNYIEAFNTSYSSHNKLFQISMVLGYKNS